MAVAVETTKAVYTGTGIVGPYTYPFKIFTSADLEVVKTNLTTGVPTVLVNNVDYTVAGVGVATGGSILLSAVLPAGYTLTIRRHMSYLQAQSFGATNAFTALAINNALDKLSMQIQQVREIADRSFQFPRDNQSPTPYLFPQANKLIGWDAAATALKNYDTATLSVPTIDHTGNHADSMTTTITDVGAANQLVLIPEAITLTASDVVPANLELWVPKGGLINLAGYTLDIQGPLTAGGYQIFSGGGTVTFTKGAVGRAINPLWWYDGSDLSTAIAAAVAAGGAGSLVNMHNVELEITAGISCRVLNNSTYDFTGTTIKADDEYAPMLNLNNAALTNGNNRGYKIHVKLPQIGRVGDDDPDSIVRTTSIGLQWYSFSRGYIEEGQISDCYYGAKLIPHDFMHIRGTKFQRNVIQCHVDATWFTATHPIGTVFEDTIFTHREGVTEKGLFWDGPFTQIRFNGASSNGDLSVSDFHFRNTAGVVNSYAHVWFQDTHFEQGLNGIKRIWFDDVSGGTRKFQHLTFDNVLMSTPRYGIGICLENVRYIRLRNCTLGSGNPVTITDATTTAASAVVTTATANKFTESGTVDQPGTDPTTDFTSTVAFATTRAHFKLIWLTGANAGEWSYIYSHSGGTKNFVLETAMPANIANGDTFKIMLVDTDHYVWGSGITPGTKILTVDSDTQFTMDANADSTRAAKTVIVMTSVPLYLDANCEAAIVDGKWTTGDGKAIYECARSEITFLPERRFINGAPLVGYSSHAVVAGDAGVVLDMQDEMGANYPGDAHPKGYVLRVAAADTGSAASTTARVTIAKDAADAAVEGKRSALSLAGVPNNVVVEQDMTVEADSSGRIYLNAVEDTAMTLTISVVELIM